MMLYVGVSAYKSNPIEFVTMYQAQEVKAAKFLVR
jgi:hypothetical protein